MAKTAALVGEKLGMTQVWDESNRIVPVTVLRVSPARVVQIRTPEKDGYSALQVTYGHRDARKLTKPLAGHYAKGDVDPGVRLVELRLDDISAYEVGQTLDADTFAAGDLIAIVPPGSPVPRYYSLASGSADGFVEICVRHLAGGVCSTFLLGLQPGEQVQAFIRENPGFALPASRRPVLLIGAGTGVAPLAGFIRRNERRVPMHLWFGARDPARDYYFRPEIERWQAEGRVASVRTAFSRVPDGGGYVQDALRRDAGRVRELVSRGALVRVCGSRPMAHDVAEILNQILSALRLSVAVPSETVTS